MFGGFSARLSAARVATSGDGAEKSECLFGDRADGLGLVGSGSGHRDSTRFFNPLRAVSMMTFSALRFNIPSNGMEMSTASW